MGASPTYRDVVREIARDQYGFITTKDATGAGVPAVELRKLAARGALVSVAYGLYRLAEAPGSPFDQFAEALLRVGDGAYLRGESVLALFGLADVNPRKVYVVAARRTRAQIPPFMDVTGRPVGEAPALTYYEGLLSMRVADAILDCRRRIEPGRLQDAVRDARAQGLITRAEQAKLQRELRSTQRSVS